MPTKICTGCNVEKKLIEFAGRQRRCISCAQAQRQRTMERKEALTFTPALGEKIVDAIAAGVSIAELCEQGGMPTARQLARWRRTIPEFAEAYEQARNARADARSDRIDEALNDLRKGKISAADCRVIVETELKMARVEAPNRYVEPTRSEVSAEVHSTVTSTHHNLIPDRRDLARAIVEILRTAPLSDAPEPLPITSEAVAVEPEPTPEPEPPPVEEVVIEPEPLPHAWRFDALTARLIPAPEADAIAHGVLVLLPDGGKTIFPLGSAPSEIERRLRAWWGVEERRA
jgi:hypothetical protein